MIENAVWRCYRNAKTGSEVRVTTGPWRWALRTRLGLLLRGYRLQRTYEPTGVNKDAK